MAADDGCERVARGLERRGAATSAIGVLLVQRPVLRDAGERAPAHERAPLVLALVLELLVGDRARVLLDPRVGERGDLLPVRGVSANASSALARSASDEVALVRRQSVTPEASMTAW